tara:strand:+ start:555 stop:929 length:375 start_codon:yes stop_codon:yes gene_type:complete
MALISVQLNFPTINVSTQLGDLVFFTSGSSLGGFNNGATSNTFLFSTNDGIIALDATSITLRYDDAIFPAGLPVGSYVSIVKNKKVNTSSLLGYYASVHFRNDSSDPKGIELFSVGSEVSESSK